MINKHLSAFIVSLFFFISCGNNTKNELLEIIDEANFIKSEKIQYRIDTIANELKNPWGLTFLPNGDLLVTERAGEIRIIRNGKLLDEKITGVPEVFASGQGGLFEIELHPNYNENNWLYLIYAAPGSGGANTAIMRAKLSSTTLTEKQVIFQALPMLSGGNHFGGRMQFGKDGYLYFSVGERGRQDNAQNLQNHSGKILRIKDNGSVPNNNPFVGQASAKPEIYTYGNRNPQGMDIHPVTGDIWTHEHGPMGGDEINIVEAGANYGWPEVTYGKNYNGTTISDFTSKPGMKDPLHYWNPSIAPCGMSFVKGDLYNGWQGNLLVGALSFRYVARLELDGNQVTHEEKLMENIGRVRAITQGPDGYIYVSTESPGMVMRIVPR